PGKGPVHGELGRESRTVGDRPLGGRKDHAYESGNSGGGRAGPGAAGDDAGGSGGSRRGRQLLEGRRVGPSRRALRPDPRGTRRPIAWGLGTVGEQAPGEVRR